MLVSRVKYEKLKELNFTPKSLMYVEPEINCEVKDINEVAEINPLIRKFDIKNYEGDFVEYVELSSVDRETGQIVQMKTVPRDKLSTRARFITKKGDILIPLIQVDKFVPTLIEKDNTIVSDNYAVIVPKCENEYIYSVFWNEYVVSQIKGKYQGAAMSRLNVSGLKTVRIPWPSENERILNVKGNEERLGKLLNIKNKKNLDIDKVNKVFKDIFKVDINNNTSYKKINYPMLSNETWIASSFLVEELKLPKNEEFSLMSLEEVCEDITLGINTSKYKGGEVYIPMIKPVNISDYIINGPFKEDEIDLNKALDKADYKVKENDILVRIRGNVGMAALVEKKYEGIVYNDFQLRLRADTSKIDVKYLWCFLNSYIGQKQIADYAKGGTMSYINQKDIQKIKIIVPSIDRQREILNKII